MKKLTRGTAPGVLARFKPGIHTWDMLDFSNREAIWQALGPMQFQLCAYCEGSLVAGKHIEHFCSRARFPQLTFEWSNLFGSCHRPDTCGNFKDNGRRNYNCEDLVNPCIHDPDDFFIIRDSGRVESRPGLNANDEARARLTIEVLNLNQDASKQRYLCSWRKRVLNSYMDRDPGVLEALLELSSEERQQYIEGELEAAQEQPFGTIVRHFFNSLLS